MEPRRPNIPQHTHIPRSHAPSNNDLDPPPRRVHQPLQSMSPIPCRRRASTRQHGLEPQADQLLELELHERLVDIIKRPVEGTRLAAGVHHEAAHIVLVDAHVRAQAAEDVARGVVVGEVADLGLHLPQVMLVQHGRVAQRSHHDVHGGAQVAVRLKEDVLVGRQTTATGVAAELEAVDVGPVGAARGLNVEAADLEAYHRERM